MAVTGFELVAATPTLVYTVPADKKGVVDIVITAATASASINVWHTPGVAQENKYRIVAGRVLAVTKFACLNIGAWVPGERVYVESDVGGVAVVVSPAEQEL